MAEERKTSFAKDVEGLHKEENALDRARALRDQFAHAQEQNNNKEQNRQSRGFRARRRNPARRW